MTEWLHAPAPCRCARCGELVDAGAPVLRLTLMGVKRRMLFGVCCRGPAPPDLPDYIKRLSTEQHRSFRKGLWRVQMGHLIGALESQGSLGPVRKKLIGLVK